MRVNHQPRGIDEILVALRVVQACDRAGRKLTGSNAERLARRRDFASGVRGATELLDRGTEVDDLDLLGRHQSRLAHEIGRALRDRQRDIGVGLEQTIGDLLEPGRVGEIRVLVQDRGQPPHRSGQAPERRRAVAVQVQDVYPFAIDDLQQRGQCRGIELGAVQVFDVDAERVQRLF